MKVALGIFRRKKTSIEVCIHTFPIAYKALTVCDAEVHALTGKYPSFGFIFITDVIVLWTIFLNAFLIINLTFFTLHSAVLGKSAQHISVCPFLQITDSKA